MSAIVGALGKVARLYCRGKSRMLLRLFRGFVAEEDLLASVETLMDLVGVMVSLRKALC